MGIQAETITVAAGQITARLMNDASETLASIASAIARAAQRRAELLVLPECAYPAYLLGSITSYRQGDHLSSGAFLAWLCGQAAEHRLHIVCGFIEDTSRELYNAAVLLDDRGRELGRARKRFLWHADHDWFARGTELRAFDSDLGRIGIVICAETRSPEIIATLAADGAELIAMPTCWINTAAEPGRYRNLQPEFLIEARAREFGVPFVCADKSGLELGPVGYVGRSRIVRADGSLAAEAPTTGDAVIAARIARRPAAHVWLSESRRERILSPREPVRPDGGRARPVTVAAVPGAIAAARLGEGMGESLFAPLRERGVQLLLLNLPQEAIAERVEMLAGAFDMHALGFPHRADAFTLGPARVGCVAGRFVGSFAAARALALDGVDVVMCFDVPDDLPILRTRAVENGVFLMGVSDHSAVIIAPDGTVLVQADPGGTGDAVATIDLARSADKQVAPDTDIFAERRVELCRF